ncbi:MAG: M14 family metallocarboxypeptidase [Gammaproteobacteria bacterium]|nr:M14 family metallocarboxypeptidase [Gammaproteobacteria bacterium]
MSDYSVIEGQPWGPEEKQQWLKNQTIKRSYQEEVVSKIHMLADRFEIKRYGALSYDPTLYPLFVLLSKNWNESLPTILVTGGVHGYETSGVHGALAFAERKAAEYESEFNFIIAPCISPWGYETINRWNPNTDDPNRSFKREGSTEEASNCIQLVKELGVKVLAHFDLHETTDTDNTEFRPAKAARDGIPNSNWNIPDGFYTVGDTAKPAKEFQKSIIDSVKRVTHIAPADENGNLIDVAIEQEGVINYDMVKAGLCAGFTGSEFATTTEVYPDSPKITDAICVDAQVAAVTGGLNYLREFNN